MLEIETEIHEKHDPQIHHLQLILIYQITPWKLIEAQYGIQFHYQLQVFQQLHYLQIMIELNDIYTQLHEEFMNAQYIHEPQYKEIFTQYIERVIMLYDYLIL